jgi:hypothetical protein
MKDESEKRIEKYLCERVKARGGLCIKLNPLWYIGIQDRLVLLPRGRIGFAELKRPKGGVHGPKQKWWSRAVTALGFRSRFLQCEDEVESFLFHL